MSEQCFLILLITVLIFSALFQIWWASSCSINWFINSVSWMLCLVSIKHVSLFVHMLLFEHFCQLNSRYSAADSSAEKLCVNLIQSQYSVSVTGTDTDTFNLQRHLQTHQFAVWIISLQRYFKDIWFKTPKSTLSFLCILKLGFSPKHFGSTSFVYCTLGYK